MTTKKWSLEKKVWKEKNVSFRAPNDGIKCCQLRQRNFFFQRADASDQKFQPHFLVALRLQQANNAWKFRSVRNENRKRMPIFFFLLPKSAVFFILMLWLVDHADRFPRSIFFRLMIGSEAEGVAEAPGPQERRYHKVKTRAKEGRKEGGCGSYGQDTSFTSQCL